MLVLQFPLSYTVSYYRSAARETGMTTGDVHKALQSCSCHRELLKLSYYWIEYTLHSVAVN